MNRSSFKSERVRYCNNGEGLSDVFKSIFNSAATKLASESSKKIIKSAAETAAKAAVEPVAKKTDEVVANKIFKSSTQLPVIEEEPKIKQDKGNIIEKELKKVYKNGDKDDDISKKFDALL